MFVLPLAKPAGYETLVIQCQMPYVLITGLEEFKRWVFCLEG
jgi:ATP synthase F1 complex assembly factor 1